jgi:hypothetical protein
MGTLYQYTAPVVLLLLSNVFMTFAWYGHLKHKSTALIAVIFISWGIAFFEYALQVPANRIGHAVYSLAELKTIQEVITFVVFCFVSVYWMNEAITWKHLLGFSMMAAGAIVVFRA